MFYNYNIKKDFKQQQSYLKSILKLIQSLQEVDISVHQKIEGLFWKK